MEMELRKKDPGNMRRTFNLMLVLAVVLWTAVCGGSMLYFHHNSKRDIEHIAHETARTGIEKDLLYRYWAAGHGGVYVPVTETTKPNPYLSHLKERDITTPSGRRLTLMHPAYMTRQVHELGRDFMGAQGRITSLQPLEPANAPDAWEGKALRTIEDGAKEFGEITNFQGQPHYRLMYPLVMVKPCLTCHEVQGYKLGDLRGGIDASIPMEIFAPVLRDHLFSIAKNLAGIWALGLAGVALASPFVRRRIVEQEKAEEALRRNLDFTQSIIDNEPECVKILGSGGEVKFMNRAGLAMIDAESIDAVLGQPVQQLVIPEHREAFIRLNERVFAGESGTLEFEMVGFKGSRLWLETHAVPLKDKTGRVESLLGITRDVTERKRAEQALSASEEQYRNLVDRSPDAIYVHVDGRIVFSNAMGVRLLGARRPEDLYGRRFMEFVHPAYRNVIGECSGSRESDSAQASLREGVFLRVDGSSVDVEVTAMPFLFSGADAVQVVARDISKRKEIERMLRKADTQYRVIVDTAHEGIIANDGSGIITLVNPRLLEMLGYSYEELLGRSIFEFMDDEERWEHQKQLELQQQGIVTQFERRFRRKDGSVIWTHASAAPLIDEQGVSRGGFGMFSDITDQKHAEEHRKKLEDQLLQSQKIESIGRLAGGIAHDINNMLTPILGYTELLEFNIPAEDPCREDLQEITNAAVRIREMTRQLLAFGRRQTLDMRSLDVNVVISKFGKMLRRTLRENITISMNLVPSIGAVLADERQIEQVLLNLAVNAQDALPASGLLVIATKDVSVDAAFAEARPGLAPGRYVVIIVSDNGMGMDGETLSRIFEPFFTTKESGRGTGLGLAMVYGIIKQHRGYVDVMSEPGGGTTFSLYLPVTADATERAQVAEQAGIQKGTETILLVEDQSDVLEIVRQLLVTLGYRVLTAADGSAARAALGSEPGPVELMITDVIMPGINGRELYEELKRTRPALKVIYMSGYSSDVISTHGVLDSGVTLIRKPFSIQEISARVRQVLDG
jgi:PAS domain S-box-containing protein